METLKIKLNGEKINPNESLLKTIKKTKDLTRSWLKTSSYVI